MVTCATPPMEKCRKKHGKKTLQFVYFPTEPMSQKWCNRLKASFVRTGHICVTFPLTEGEVAKVFSLSYRHRIQWLVSLLHSGGPWYNSGSALYFVFCYQAGELMLSKKTSESRTESRGHIRPQWGAAKPQWGGPGRRSPTAEKWSPFSRYFTRLF